MLKLNLRSEGFFPTDPRPSLELSFAKEIYFPIIKMRELSLSDV